STLALQVRVRAADSANYDFLGVTNAIGRLLNLRRTQSCFIQKARHRHFDHDEGKAAVCGRQSGSPRAYPPLLICVVNEDLNAIVNTAGDSTNTHGVNGVGETRLQIPRAQLPFDLHYSFE